MLVFLIIYLTGFWFFKTYKSRWIYWLSIMVLYPMLMATFGFANPEELGRMCGAFIGLLIFTTLIRWICGWIWGWFEKISK
jgi:hypothetical protein